MTTKPQPGLYEVLTRREDGHETVHRVRADDQQAAEQIVADRAAGEAWSRAASVVDAARVTP